VVEALSPRRRHALDLFATLGPTYDRYARLLSLGQDPRWRRFLVSRIEAGHGDTVLDVATGTGAVALELVRQKGCSVVGVDQSEVMLAEARRRVGDEPIRLREGSAESLPAEDGAFDGLTFAYVLRYVDDPAQALGEFARVVRPGGVVAGLDFAVPRGVARPLWELYVRVGLPALGSLIAPGWHAVGRFLGHSIRDFYARYPVERLAALWQEAGLGEPRVRLLSLGGGLVVWGRRS
jgi:demethylmenaquinone methyltransferase / 2-methoxy-6-polyprenyl-1,4-benzoquinol methylase